MDNHLFINWVKQQHLFCISITLAPSVPKPTTFVFQTSPNDPVIMTFSALLIPSASAFPIFFNPTNLTKVFPCKAKRTKATSASLWELSVAPSDINDRKGASLTSHIVPLRRSCCSDGFNKISTSFVISIGGLIQHTEPFIITIGAVMLS